MKNLIHAVIVKITNTFICIYLYMPSLSIFTVGTASNFEDIVRMKFISFLESKMIKFGLKVPVRHSLHATH